MPTVFCRRCGTHGSWQWRGLLANCPGKPRTAQADKWLLLACQGIGPPKQDFKKVSKRSYTRKRLLRPKTGASHPLHKSALGNKSFATAEDRYRWALIDGGICRSCPLSTPGPQAAEVQDSTPPSARVVVKPVVVADLLPVMVDTDVAAESEGTDCPNCAAFVLSSDEHCNQCGLRRRTRAEDDSLLTGGAEAGPTREGETQNGCSGVLSQIGKGRDGMSHNAMDVWSVGRWHGGTFAPPPYMAGYGSSNAGDPVAVAAPVPSRQPRLQPEEPGGRPADKVGKRKAELNLDPPPKRVVCATLLPALGAMRERIRLKELAMKNT